MLYNISYWCISHIGKVRSINQDNFICDGQFMEASGKQMDSVLHGAKTSKEHSVFGIFDGMGGEACGEIASYIAAKSASALEIGKDPVKALSQFCQNANADICSYANRHEVPAMGTTAAMLAFTGSDITLCNIGDSKIFRFCDGILEQISKDHLAVAAFGVKPPLSQNLGISPDELVIEPYLAQGAYHNGDIYLICSDGLTDMVSVDRITEVLTTAPIESAAALLLDEVLANGGKDNTTIILCKVEHRSGWFFKRKHHKKWKEG